MEVGYAEFLKARGQVVRVIVDQVAVVEAPDSEKRCDGRAGRHATKWHRSFSQVQAKQEEGAPSSMGKQHVLRASLDVPDNSTVMDWHE